LSNIQHLEFNSENIEADDAISKCTLDSSDSINKLLAKLSLDTSGSLTSQFHAIILQPWPNVRDISQVVNQSVVESFVKNKISSLRRRNKQRD